jgi:hypothetical protein
MSDHRGPDADHGAITDSHELWLGRLDNGIVADENTVPDLDSPPAVQPNTQGFSARCNASNHLEQPVL